MSVLINLSFFSIAQSICIHISLGVEVEQKADNRCSCISLRVLERKPLQRKHFLPCQVVDGENEAWKFEVKNKSTERYQEKKLGWELGESWDVGMLELGKKAADFSKMDLKNQ